MSDHDRSLLEEARQKHTEAVGRMDEWNARIKALPDDAPADEVDFLSASFEKEKQAAKRWAEAAERTEATLNARQALKPQDADNGKPPAATLQVSEPLTYRKNGPNLFFRDVLNSKSDPGAQERLNRHAAEMRVEMRDITTTDTAGGEFVPPLWLQGQWVELLRAARPTADRVTRFDLPPGTDTINLPRLTGGGATAIQTANNAAVQETDPTTDSISAGVKTIAGQIDMSRQLFDLSNPGMDEVLFRDLARDYATKLDIQVLSGSGSAGQALGIRNVSSINAVTYSDSSPTAGELYPNLADAIQRVNTAFGVPDTIVMHPRRWGALLGAVDTTGRPLIDAVAGMNAFADRTSNQAQGIVGSLQGLAVIVDPNIPTNLGTNTREDVILVFDSNQIFLWEEGAPRTRVFEDIGSGTLTVRLSMWGYFAFMAGRYPALISTISGTGMDPPTF